MEIILTILSIIAAIGLFLWYKFNQIVRETEKELENADPEDAAASCEESEREIAESRAMLEKLQVYRTLRASVTDNMTLDQLIDAFQQMCALSVGEPDDLLFETGTYRFDGEKLFHFSLVRQFQFMDEDEYVQLHLEALYTPSARTFGLRSAVWDQRIDKDFFSYVKSSPAYHAVKEMPIVKVNLWIDET